MIREAPLVRLVMLAVVVRQLAMVAAGVNLGVVFLIEGQILDRLHDVVLSQVNEGLDVVHKTLVLDLSALANVLLDFDGVLIELGSQLASHLYLLMCESDVVLQDVEHGLVALEQNPVLMDVHVARRECVRANVRCIDDTEAVLDEDFLIQGLSAEEVLVLLGFGLLMSHLELLLFEEIA